jgi:predicted O-methyltransferase YrrM
MNPVNTLKRVVRDADSSAQMLAEIREGVNNQSSLINRKMTELIGVCNKLASVQQAQAEIMVELLQSLGAQAGKPVDVTQMQKKLADAASFQKPPAASDSAPSASGARTTFKEAMANIPLMIDEKTYNTAHPDYDANKVRNHPGTIFNFKKPSANAVYQELLKLAKKDVVPDNAWDSVLKETLAEVKTVPHSEQVFERKAYIEQYMRELSERYQAHYVPGWVNIEDALFLYWTVRRLKPKTIVQTGVCNGLSSAFMMLALAKNGPEGRLYVVDLAPVFNPKDPAWTVRNNVYGVVIPEGKSTGWIVPDAYRDRFEVHQGDAKKLLPPLVAKLPSIDMFYHDSDHTYNHMMFEFREAKKKLNPGGLIVGDDISWNASVWDFADEYGVPSYNYKGTVGLAFF